MNYFISEIAPDFDLDSLNMSESIICALKVEKLSVMWIVLPVSYINYKIPVFYRHQSSIKLQLPSRIESKS